MRTVVATPQVTDAGRAEGLLELTASFTRTLKAVCKAVGSVDLPTGATYSMGYINSGLRCGGDVASVLVRTTADGSAILETPAQPDGERDAYYRTPETPALADVEAYIADRPAIEARVAELKATDPVLAAALDSALA